MQVILLSHGKRILMEIATVGLQVNDSTFSEEIAIAVHEQRSCQALLLTADLRIRECDPDLRNLARSEERLDELDTSTEETYVLKSMLLSVFRTFPKTRSLDVHTDIVACRVALSKVNSIITLTAAQLKDDRVVVAEEITAPVTLHRVIAVQNL